jgi:hypothetical protein
VDVDKDVLVGTTMGEKEGIREARANYAKWNISALSGNEKETDGDQEDLPTQSGAKRVSFVDNSTAGDHMQRYFGERRQISSYRGNNT